MPTPHPPTTIWSLDAPETPVVVTGDGGRLHQVVANLLANARVHTPAGTRSRSGCAVDGGFAVLTVPDDGPGISEELQAVLFERFARGDASRARKTGSDRARARRSWRPSSTGTAATVAVKSAPGKTVFTVRLPLAAH